MPRKTRNILQQIKAACAELRRYHSIGTASNREMPKRKYGGIKAQCKKRGINENYLHKSRKFAREYSPERLEKLCERCVQGRYPLRWSQILIILGVKDKDRDKLVHRAIENRWTFQSLRREIRRFRGTSKSRAGRPVLIAVDRQPGLALQRMQEQCEMFNKLIDALKKKGTDDEATAFDGFPMAVRKAIENAKIKIDQVIEAIPQDQSPARRTARK